MMIPLILWIILRILTSITAGLVSSFKPLTTLEKLIAVWPPAAPASQWLERVFISPWMRWDAAWYEAIVNRGYSASDGTAQFHPLYAWLVVPLARIGMAAPVSLLLVSALAGIGVYFAFFRLAQLDLPRKDATFALMLFAFAPPAVILFAPYSEAVFLLAAVLCMYFLRKKSWWLAGLMGGLAALTRQQGIFLMVPMVWELWENSDRTPGALRRQWRGWLALLLIPVGLLVWLVYRAVFLNDMHAGFTTFHQFIYSIVISPSASHVVPSQQFSWPWLVVKYALTKLFTQPDVDIWVNLVLGAVSVVLLGLAWTRMRLSYRLYSLVITLVSFSYYTGPSHPVMGLPRHLYLAFPIFIGMAVLIKKPWLRLIIIAACAIGLLFLLVLYVLETWIP